MYIFVLLQFICIIFERIMCVKAEKLKNDHFLRAPGPKSGFFERFLARAWAKERVFEKFLALARQKFLKFLAVRTLDKPFLRAFMRKHFGVPKL